LRRIFHLTYPLFLGYVSVGFVFGVVAVGQGLPAVFAILSSVFVYAGASQFLLVNLVSSGTALLQIFIAVFLLNLRHLFYYKPVERIMPKTGPARWYSILALTDEAFALMSKPDMKPEDTYAALMMVHGYWIFGTALGALVGGGAIAKLEGLDFSLIALFTVLLIDKLKWKKDVLVLGCTFLISFTLWENLAERYFLITAIGLSLALAVWLEKRGENA
jgi:4-azaleucine resistance transporter AzlC